MQETRTMVKIPKEVKKSAMKAATDLEITFKEFVAQALAEKVKKLKNS